MIYYFASKNEDLKGGLPLASIGKSKNQYCHKTIKEAVIYMINPSILNAERVDLEEFLKNTNCNISFYLYECEKVKGNNLGYNKNEFAKIISREKIDNLKEFFKK